MSYSPSDGRPTPSLVLLLGAPRSGTTWLQRLIGASPAVATSQETGLLDAYVGAWHDIWHRQLHGDNPARWANQRHRGLPALLTEEEFQRILRDAISSVYGKTLDLKPGASIVLDKTPGNGLSIPVIGKLIPEARVLHIIRDGRDVAESLVAAGRSWGRNWAPDRVEAAARIWRDSVNAVRDAGNLTDSYLEVRYESLLTEGPETLARCLTFCGLNPDMEWCRRIYNEQQFIAMPDTRPSKAATPDPILWAGEVVRRLGSAPTEPPGFYRQGRAGSWHSTWRAGDRWRFAHVAGELLVALGYEPDARWSAVSIARENLLGARRGLGVGLRSSLRRAAAFARPYLR